MVAFSAITDAELAVNKPITSSLMFRLRDNPTATFETNKGIASAWVNFNGVGSLAIRDSHNVTSVTDNGVGDYTINFTATYGNTNYCWVANSVAGPSGYYSGGFTAGLYSSSAYYAKSTTTLRLKSQYSNGGSLDMFDANIIIFGGN